MSFSTNKTELIITQKIDYSKILALYWSGTDMSIVINCGNDLIQKGFSDVDSTIFQICRDWWNVMGDKIVLQKVKRATPGKFMLENGNEYHYKKVGSALIAKPYNGTYAILIWNGSERFYVPYDTTLHQKLIGIYNWSDD